MQLHLAASTPPFNFEQLRQQAQQLQRELAQLDRQTLVFTRPAGAAPAGPAPPPAGTGYPGPLLSPAEQAQRQREAAELERARVRFTQRRLAEINSLAKILPVYPILVQAMRASLLSQPPAKAKTKLAAKAAAAVVRSGGPDCFMQQDFWITQAPDWVACAKTVYKMLDTYYGKNYHQPTDWYTLVKEHKTGAWFHNIPVRKGYDILATAKSAEGLDKLEKYMVAHKPVMVGVSHTENFYFKSTNKKTKITTYSMINDGTIDHFVAIVGVGIDKKGKYYRFFDVGTADIVRGTSKLNRLYLQSDGSYRGYSQATYKNYILTQVRF